MLSKEKIEQQAESYMNVTDKFVPVSQLTNREKERAFIAGATWASEQYAGVVKELKGLIKRWNQSELTMEYLEETFPTLEEELNKLNQP